MNVRSLRVLTAASCLLGAAGAASAQGLLASEPFAYGGTPNLQGASGGSGWSSQWFKLSPIPTGAVPTGLTYPNLLTSGGSAITAPYPSVDFTRYSRALAAYTDPDDTIYISCLVQPNVGYGTTAGLAFGTWENGMVMGARPTGVYGLMTPPDTAHGDSAVPVAQGQSALLVARVKKNVDATITWSLFVNPTVGGPEPTTAAASLTVPGTALPPAVMIYNDGGFLTDEIRLGQTWSSVLPTDALPGDVTGDGAVDIDDLFAVINAWGDCGGQPCPADVTGDGVVDVDDLFTVINHWNS